MGAPPLTMERSLSCGKEQPQQQKRRCAVDDDKKSSSNGSGSKPAQKNHPEHGRFVGERLLPERGTRACVQGRCPTRGARQDEKRLDGLAKPSAPSRNNRTMSCFVSLKGFRFSSP